MLVGDIPRNNARRYPAKPAVIESGRTRSWSEVDDRASRLANHFLANGLSKGDRVLVIARNCIEWPEMVFALAKAGLVSVPVNIRLAPDELAHIRDDAGVTAAVVHSAQVDRFGSELNELDTVVQIGGDAVGTEYESALRAASPTDPAPADLTPDDTQFILYTSGTTGRAKGVVHAHRGMLAQAVDTNLVTEGERSDVFLATDDVDFA